MNKSKTGTQAQRLRQAQGLRQRERRLGQALPNTLLIQAPPGELKMSDVLKEFVEPYADTWRNEEELGRLLVLAIIAWNTALQPLEEREDSIQCNKPD